MNRFRISICFPVAGVVLLLVGRTGIALAQQSAVRDTTMKAVADTAGRTVADTSARIDTLRVRFIPAIGSLRLQIDSSGEFHASQLVWTDARSFGNLVWKLPGFVLRDLGEPAKPGQVNGWGVDWRGIAILMDGRPMNDPITGTYNLSDMPMEFVEQMEDFEGSSSTGQSWNAPGGALNFVTRQYNTLRPVTKVRFVQSPDNTLLTDGLFAQNLARGLNFMFGFQRQVSDGRFNGARTTNLAPATNGSVVDNWNVRTRLRYNFSDRFNLVLTDFYTKDINGLNGGIDRAQTTNIFDNVAAFVHDPNGLETVARRDVSLLGIAKLTDDSTTITRVNAYYTHLERRYGNPGSEFTSLNISDLHDAEVRGLRIQQSIQSSFHRTEFGLQTEHSQYSSSGFLDTTQNPQNVNHAKRSITSAFLTTSLHPVDFASVGFNGRFDNDGGESAPSFGAELSFQVLPFVRLFGEYGRSYRFPTYQESSWADSSIVRPSPIGKEQHTLVRGGAELSFGENGVLSATVFDRKVHDAIVFQPSAMASGNPAIRILNVSQVHTQGVAGSLDLRYGPFGFEGTLLYTQYQEADTTKLLLPDLILGGELSYRNKFFNDALDGKIGIRTHFMSRQRGMTFNPRLMLYAENTATDIGQWTRLDAFLVLKIGSAYINLSYENILGANYLITPIYPMPPGSFRLGVNWLMID